MRRVFNLLVILALLLGLSGNNPPVQAQTGEEPQARAQILLNTMTPEERVGQLFLVSFNGSELKPDSPIATLINKYLSTGRNSRFAFFNASALIFYRIVLLFAAPLSSSIAG